MTKLYVLIVLTHVYGGQIASLHDFSSKEKCEDAAKEIMQNESLLSRTKTICVPK